MSLQKYRIGEVAKDFGIPSKQVMELITEKYEKPKSHQQVLTDEQLKRYPLIGLGANTSSFAFYSEFFNKLGLPYAPDVEAATADQILPMIKSELGIGFVPTDFLETEALEKLIILKMEPPIPSRNICMLKRRNTPLSVAAAKLERMIRQ